MTKIQKHKKRGDKPMSIGMILLGAIGGLTGLLCTAYLVISLPAVIIWKIYRKIRFGYTLYQ